MAQRQFFLDPPKLEELQSIIEDSMQTNQTRIFYIGKFNSPPNSRTVELNLFLATAEMKLNLRIHEPYENSVRKSNKVLSQIILLSGSPIIVRLDPYRSK